MNLSFLMKLVLKSKANKDKSTDIYFHHSLETYICARDQKGSNFKEDDRALHSRNYYSTVIFLLKMWPVQGQPSFVRHKTRFHFRFVVTFKTPTA